MKYAGDIDVVDNICDDSTTSIDCNHFENRIVTLYTMEKTFMVSNGISLLIYITILKKNIQELRENSSTLYDYCIKMFSNIELNGEYKCRSGHWI